MVITDAPFSYLSTQTAGCSHLYFALPSDSATKKLHKKLESINKSYHAGIIAMVLYLSYLGLLKQWKMDGSVLSQQLKNI